MGMGIHNIVTRAEWRAGTERVYLTCTRLISKEARSEASDMRYSVSFNGTQYFSYELESQLPQDHWAIACDCMVEAEYEAWTGDGHDFDRAERLRDLAWRKIRSKVLYSGLRPVQGATIEDRLGMEIFGDRWPDAPAKPELCPCDDESVLCAVCESCACDPEKCEACPARK